MLRRMGGRGYLRLVSTDAELRLWGGAVLQAVRRAVDDGSDRANGVRILRAWSTAERGAAVLYVVYRHPWWTFTTGLRWVLDDPPPPAAWASNFASSQYAPDIVLELGEPLGREGEALQPDDDGVWWWGDDPLPGQGSKRPGPGF